MSSTTPNLGLFKYNTTADANVAFSITKALNNNWDIIDEKYASLNNPYSLFDSKYSDHELNNLSWLKSSGQWNSKAVYTDAYDKLLKVYNGTETVEGLSVKLSTEEYTDYDFVLNTADETFRLPLLDGSELIPHYPQDASDVVYTISSSNPFTASKNGVVVITPYDGYCTYYVNGREVSTQADVANGLNSQSVVVSTRKGDILTTTNNDSSDLRYYPYVGNGSLYFYVGETVQDANLIDAGRIGEQLATKTDMLQASGAGMPSEKYINLTLGANGTTYTAPANGWFTFSRKTTAPASCGLFNITKNIGCEYVIERSLTMMCFVPCIKGDVVRVGYWQGSSTNYFRFIYAEGSKED